jgi:Global regulator protein family
MVVLTKRASEEVVMDKPVRVVVLETARDHVTLGVLDPGDGFAGSRRGGFPDSDRGTVKVIAPYGEEIEIDG